MMIPGKLPATHVTGEVFLQSVGLEVLVQTSTLTKVPFTYGANERTDPGVLSFMLSTT